jgi:hypothetical protein
MNNPATTNAMVHLNYEDAIGLLEHCNIDYSVALDSVVSGMNVSFSLEIHISKDVTRLIGYSRDGNVLCHQYETTGLAMAMVI